MAKQVNDRNRQQLFDLMFHGCQSMNLKQAKEVLAAIRAGDITDLAEKYRFALYSNNQEQMLEAAKNYFDVVHDMRA